MQDNLPAQTGSNTAARPTPLSVNARTMAQAQWPDAADTLEELGHTFLALAPLVREARRRLLPPTQPFICVGCGDDLTHFNDYQRQIHERAHPLRVKVRQWLAS